MVSNKQKLAVIGAGSMVGSRFCELQTKFDLIKADLSGNIALDITNWNQVQNFFAVQEFDIAILFSAFTDVNAAEGQRADESGAAWKINVEGAQNVAQMCADTRRRMVYISTDFVFDGKDGPYNEESQRAQNENDLSWYGLTKLRGEEKVEKVVPDFIILRISFPYRSNFPSKIDFARSILKKYDTGQLHPMFTDQVFTPTFIDDIAPSLELLVSENHSGIFHVASPETTTPFEFAKCLLEKFGRDPYSLEKSSIVQHQMSKKTAPRPVKGGLKVEKISSLGFTPTSWRDGIDKIFEQSGGKLILDHKFN